MWNQGHVASWRDEKAAQLHLECQEFYGRDKFYLEPWQTLAS